MIICDSTDEYNSVITMPLAHAIDNFDLEIFVTTIGNNDAIKISFKSRTVVTVWVCPEVINIDEFRHNPASVRSMSVKHPDYHNPTSDPQLAINTAVDLIANILNRHRRNVK